MYDEGCQGKARHLQEQEVESKRIEQGGGMAAAVFSRTRAMHNDLWRTNTEKVIVMGWLKKINLPTLILLLGGRPACQAR